MVVVALFGFVLVASAASRRGCQQGEVVGQKHQRLAGIGILESDTTYSKSIP